MSRELLKTSLRHTHAYIDAYGVDLLQEVEMLFRQALEKLEDTDETDEDDEQGDLSVSFETVAEPAVAVARPVAPNPASAPVRKQEPTSPEQIFIPVARWHFYLPATVAAMAVAFFLVWGLLS
ncbi:MAG: hypothetical protein CMJ62_21155 [Planctomycetaceae bacterium]|nr:hypothetical protein [Planctomycetaceae bacterium]|tara:strand:+ start:15199 stop:15567 length:369 start_codon:yes stop_codon:yes gene_type:complete